MNNPYTVDIDSSQKEDDDININKHLNNNPSIAKFVSELKSNLKETRYMTISKEKEKYNSMKNKKTEMFKNGLLCNLENV